MAERFLLRRGQLAREQARLQVEASERAIARFVQLASALADRMEAAPLGDLQRARERSDRVRLLRDAAGAGERALHVHDVAPTSEQSDDEAQWPSRTRRTP